jgi:murein DD-endopeptidase MepM/ murein hydrolase activator NlpD
VYFMEKKKLIIIMIMSGLVCLISGNINSGTGTENLEKVQETSSQSVRMLEDTYTEDSAVTAVPIKNPIEYKVQSGDTVWGLAHRFDTEVSAIMEANGLIVPEELLAGQVLIISSNSQAQSLFKPVEGIVSSVFGMRNGRMHEGIDIAAEEDKSIYAVDDGLVVFSGPRGDYGNTVILKHQGRLRTLYAHTSHLLVKQGEHVLKGQEIALIGSTGHSTGSHLHLEFLFDGNPVNPAQYIAQNL